MPAPKHAALLLAKRRGLLSPGRGFYVIVPLEHREAGAPPLETWLPALLRFHGVRAGEVVVEAGGVAVTVDRPMRPCRCGALVVRFRVGLR